LTGALSAYRLTIPFLMAYKTQGSNSIAALCFVCMLLFPCTAFLRPIQYPARLNHSKPVGMKPRYVKKQCTDDSNQVAYKAIHAVPADSPEVLYRHYCDQIACLQVQLNTLNLLEHPCEIQAVCGHIILTQKKIGILAEKHKIQQHSLQPGLYRQ